MGWSRKRCPKSVQSVNQSEKIKCMCVKCCVYNIVCTYVCCCCCVCVCVEQVQHTHTLEVHVIHIYKKQLYICACVGANCVNNMMLPSE